MFLINAVGKRYDICFDNLTVIKKKYLNWIEVIENIEKKQTKNYLNFALELN